MGNTILYSISLFKLFIFVPRQVLRIYELVLCQEKVQIKMSKLFLNISMYHKLVQIIAAFAFILFYPTSFAAFCKYCVSYWLGDL